MQFLQFFFLIITFPYNIILTSERGGYNQLLQNQPYASDIIKNKNGFLQPSLLLNSLNRDHSQLHDAESQDESLLNQENLRKLKKLKFQNNKNLSDLLRKCWKRILSDKDSVVKIKDNKDMLEFLSKQVNGFKDILYGRKVNTNEIDLIAMYCMFLFINKVKENQLKDVKPKICGPSKLFFNERQKNNLSNCKLYFKNGSDGCISQISMQKYMEENKNKCLSCGHYNAILCLFEIAYGRFTKRVVFNSFYSSMIDLKFDGKEIEAENKIQGYLYESIKEIFNYVYGVQESNILENNEQIVTKKKLYKHLIKYFTKNDLLLNIHFIDDDANKKLGRPKVEFITDDFFDQNSSEYENSKVKNVSSNVVLPSNNAKKRKHRQEPSNLPGETLRKKGFFNGKKNLAGVLNNRNICSEVPYEGFSAQSSFNGGFQQFNQGQQHFNNPPVANQTFLSKNLSNGSNSGFLLNREEQNLNNNISFLKKNPSNDSNSGFLLNHEEQNLNQGKQQGLNNTTEANQILNENSSNKSQYGQGSSPDWGREEGSFFHNNTFANEKNEKIIQNPMDDNSLKVQLIKNFFGICKDFRNNIIEDFLHSVITNNYESNIIVKRLLGIINNNTFKDPQFLITQLLNIFQKEKMCAVEKK